MITKEKLSYDHYPLWWVIGQNFFLLIYFGIGFAGMYPLKIYNIPWLSILYALFLIVMLLFVLRKHLCTHCYYYGKFCNVGWGKLAALMFEENSGNYQLGVKLAGITWATATVVPILGMIWSYLVTRSTTIIILLVIFILLTPISFLTHKKSCERCKMRERCPASMYKRGNS